MTVTKYKRLASGTTENNEPSKSETQSHSTGEGLNDFENPEPTIDIPKIKARADIGIFQKSISTLILILVYFTLSITITFYQRRLLSVSFFFLEMFLWQNDFITYLNPLKLINSYRESL